MKELAFLVRYSQGSVIILHKLDDIAHATQNVAWARELTNMEDRSSEAYYMKAENRNFLTLMLAVEEWVLYYFAVTSSTFGFLKTEKNHSATL